MTITVILNEVKNLNELPALLKYYITTENYTKNKDKDNSKLLSDINTENFLNPEQIQNIKSLLNA